jgi:RNase P/RNase MRP subunit p29
VKIENKQVHKMNGDGEDKIEIGMIVETIGGMRPGKNGRVVNVTKHQCTIVNDEIGRFSVYKKNVRVIAVKAEEPEGTGKTKEKIKKIMGRMQEIQAEMKELEEAMAELLMGL